LEGIWPVRSVRKNRVDWGAPLNIRTVVGDEDAHTLGFTHCHDHLFVFQADYTVLLDGILLDDYERTAQEVMEFRRRGGSALVDLQPFGAGRHAGLLERLAIETGVTVIACTGLHKAPFYSSTFWFWDASTDEIADLFISELVEGMYDFNKSDPFEHRSAVRAGVIKIASEEEGLTPLYRKVFEAAVKAHKAAGAPIITHAETAESGIQQAEYLLERGVRPEHVTISHMDRRIDWSSNIRCAQLGVFLEYDTIGRFKYHGDAEEIDLIRTMIKRGFASQITVGMDSTRERFLSYGGSLGLHYLLETFVPALRANGVGEREIELITVENPRRALAWEKLSAIGPGNE